MPLFAIRCMINSIPNVASSSSLWTQLNTAGLLGNNEISVGAAIACFLAQEGADINYANHKGKSPLDLVADSTTVQLIKNFSEQHRYTPLGSPLSSKL